MIYKAIRRAVIPAMALGLLAATPARADFSDGYKFLEAVKKKDGDKVEKAIMDNVSIINSKDVTTGETALHVVAAKRDLTWLSYLLAKGANPNAADDRGRTPLEVAVNLGWRDGAEALLSQKASPDTSNDAGETPLIFAVHRRDQNLIKLLLQAGANPDRADNSGRSARDYARIEGEGSGLVSVIETFGREGAAKPKAVYGPTF